MELTNKLQDDTLYEEIKYEAPQVLTKEAPQKTQSWWDAQCYPDAHESER